MRDHIQLSKDFLSALFVNRNIKASGTYLSDDVMCIGTDSHDIIRSIPAVLSYLTEILAKDISPYRILYHEIEQYGSEDSGGYVCISFDLLHPDTNISVFMRFSASVISEYGRQHICFFHMSVPSLLSKNDRPDNVMDNIPSGIGVFRVSSRGLQAIFLNKAISHFFASDLGQSDDLRSVDMLSSVHPEDRKELERLISQSSFSVSGIEDTFRILKADGKYHWINIHFSSFPETSHSQLIYASFTDMDYLKLLEEKQHFYDELSYRAVAGEKLITSMFVNLSSDLIEDINGTDARIYIEKTSMHYSECLHLASMNIADKDAADTFLSKLSSRNLISIFRQGSSSFSYEYFAKNSSGASIWTLCSVKMMRRPGCKDIIAFIYTKDINRERMMREITDNILEKQYDFICYVEGSRNTYRMLSMRSAISNIIPEEGSDYESDMTGYIRRYAIDADAEALIQALHIDSIRSLLEKSDSASHFGTFSASDNSLHYKKIQVYYLDRTNMSLALIMTDYTDTQRSQLSNQEMLLSALESAKQANKAKSVFLSRMSHELRTPISSIIGLTDISLMDSSVSPELFDRFSKIAMSSKHLLTLINKILDMSGIESGITKLVNEPFETMSLIKDIQKNIDMDCQIGGVTFSVTTSDNLPEKLTGDSAKLRQILSNILENSVRFTPRGGNIGMSVTVESSDTHSVQVLFSIKDTGIGISDSFMPHIFEAFSQENISNSSQYGGTGLGLAITKNIVSLMGGTISVDSKKNRGTTVDVVIPLSVYGVIISPEPENYPDKDYDFTGKHILVAEDNALNVEILKYLLTEKHFETDFAADGLQALQMFSSSPVYYYSCILMDIKMPNMDGLEASSKIRHLIRTDAASLPIIAMSAGSSSEDVQAVFSSGMNEHLIKPVDPNRLFYTLNKYIR